MSVADQIMTTSGDAYEAYDRLTAEIRAAESFGVAVDPELLDAIASVDAHMLAEIESGCAAEQEHELWLETRYHDQIASEPGWAR